METTGCRRVPSPLHCRTTFPLATGPLGPPFESLSGVGDQRQLDCLPSIKPKFVSVASCSPIVAYRSHHLVPSAISLHVTTEEMNLCQIIFKAAAFRLLRLRSYIFTIPLRGLYALLDSPLPLFAQHDFRRVPTQPELHGER